MGRFALKCFGVGDGWPSAERGHAAFLYRFETGALLLDCGEPISRSWKASGLEYDLIDHVFLSHLHFDHSGGLFMLLQSMWLEGRTKDLQIHAPVVGIEPIRQLLRAATIFDELLRFRLQFAPLQSGQPVDWAGIRVTPFPTTHFSRTRRVYGAKYPQAFEAFCFLIEGGGSRIVHSADVGSVEDLAPLLDQPVQLMVCELAHVPPERMFRFLHTRPIERICFVHLSRACRERLPELKTLAAKVFQHIPFFFAEDGDEFSG